MLLPLAAASSAALQVCASARFLQGSRCQQCPALVAKSLFAGFNCPLHGCSQSVAWLAEC